jgi:hypothetical protein
LLAVKTLVTATGYASHTTVKVGTVLHTVTAVARVNVAWITNVFIHKAVPGVTRVLTAPIWSTVANERKGMYVEETVSEKDALLIVSVEAQESIATNLRNNVH